MSECRGDILIYNGLEADSANIDKSLFYSSESYYEVVRVIGGKPIFLKDHISRLEGSLSAASRDMLIDGDNIFKAVYNLIELTSFRNGNIKFSFNFSEEQNYSLIYFIEAHYPTDKLYKTGINAIIFAAERDRPGIKLYNYQLRSQIYDKLVRTGAYEAFLLNAEEQLTEGSKSNVFFIKRDSIVTAPEGKVLAGITRKYALDLCEKNKIKVELRCLAANELLDVDSVFITGTSPGILPVSTLPGYEFDVNNDKLRFLMEEYNKLIEIQLA